MGYSIAICASGRGVGGWGGGFQNVWGSIADFYTYPSIAFPLPETECSDGELSRGDEQMGIQMDGFRKNGGYFGNTYGISRSRNAPNESAQVGNRNSGKGDRYLNTAIDGEKAMRNHKRHIRKR